MYYFSLNHKIKYNISWVFFNFKGDVGSLLQYSPKHSASSNLRLWWGIWHKHQTVWQKEILTVLEHLLLLLCLITQSSDVSLSMMCRDECVNVIDIGKYVFKINYNCHTLSISTLMWWKNWCRRTWNTGKSLFHQKGRWSRVLSNCWGKRLKRWDREWLLSRTVPRYSGQKENWLYFWDQLSLPAPGVWKSWIRPQKSQD